MKRGKNFKCYELFLLGICSITLLMTCTWLFKFHIEARNNQHLMEQLASTMSDKKQFLVAPFLFTVSPTPITVAPISSIRISSSIGTFSSIRTSSSIGTSSAKEENITVLDNDTREANENPQMLQQFTELYHQNPDILGWVLIDGTNINYPIMYTPDDGEYYLHRNYNKEEEKRGLPFLDAGTNLLLSQNYLVYGHNMKDGTGFHDLLKYTEESYYKEHSIIHFNTLYEEADYEIIAVFKSQIFYENQDVFKYYKFTNIEEERDYREYIDNIKEKSIYDTGVTASFGEKLLTLSTCSYHITDGRFIIVAKKK